MGDRTTTEGGEFPLTSWGLIAGVKASTPEARREALDKLCARYWKPVFGYVRRAWSQDVDDAKDLTQAFFVSILEGDALARYEPGRASFRTYLKMLLRGFAADRHDAVKALKRGGGARRVAIDENLPNTEGADPEQVFDRAWRAEILEKAVARTRETFAAEDRAVQFRVFEEYDLVAPDRRPTYGQVAEALGLKETLVRNYLFVVRERLRGEIRAELANTVRDPQQLEDEWSALFGG